MDEPRAAVIHLHRSLSFERSLSKHWLLTDGLFTQARSRALHRPFCLELLELALVKRAESAFLKTS